MDRAALISILGVAPDPTTGEVRSARRLVARNLHPDVTGGSVPLMSDVNAACDEWIAEIRRARATPTSEVRREPSVPEHGLRRIDVAATLALIVFGAILVVTVVGPSGASIAAGLLVGALAAALFLAILYRLS